MNGGTVKATGSGPAINMSAVGSEKGGTLVINDGEVKALFEGGVGIMAYRDTEVTITGGTVKADSYALRGRAGTGSSSSGDKAKFTVTGGSIISTGASAIWAPQAEGVVTVSGGTISGYDSGIIIGGGTLTVTDGIISGKTDSYSPALIVDKKVAVTGCAIAVIQDTDKSAIQVNVSGGTLTGYLPFSESNPRNNDTTSLQRINYSITGGLFHSTGTQAVGIADYLNGPFISGGRFTYSVSNYVMDSYAEFQNTGTDPYFVRLDKPAFVLHSLVLTGRIGVNFFMDLTSLTDEQRAASYVDFTVSGKNGGIQHVPFNENFKNSSGEYYGFTCSVNSVQMADTITAVFHYSDGEGEKTLTKEYTVEEYLSNFTDSQIPSLNGLVRAVSDYGYYAQRYLSAYAVTPWVLGTDHKEMTGAYTGSYSYALSDLSPYAIQKQLSSDISGVSYSLTLDSDTAINLFIAPVSGYEGDITVTVDGNVAVPVLTGGRYKIVISGINSLNLAHMHHVVITTTDGQSTVDVSVLSYAYAAMNDSSEANMAMCALYDYYLKSVAYDEYIKSLGN